MDENVLITGFNDLLEISERTVDDMSIVLNMYCILSGREYDTNLLI